MESEEAAGRDVAFDGDLVLQNTEELVFRTLKLGETRTLSEMGSPWRGPLT